MGLSASELKTRYSNAINDERIQLISANEKLTADGYNRSERARMMGVNESTIRSLENKKSQEKTERARRTAEELKKQVDAKGPIDISTGVEIQLGVSKAKLKEAVKILEDEGYEIRGGQVEQPTNKGKFTTMRYICPPGTPKNAAFQFDKLHMVDPLVDRPIDITSDDNGISFRKAFQYPASMDSARIYVRYGDEGGKERDGTIEIRPGVPDLSLGKAHYSQVRILVDDTKYMKGMAHYMDPQTAMDIPKGYDVIYNTRKNRDKADEVFKKISNDPNNPFNSLIKANGQSEYIDPKTGEKKLSLINKRADEGDWNEWSDRLPSQFLSKQRTPLINQQLNLSIAEKRDELDEILSLNNPTIKKKLLIDFANEADKAAVHLYAAALPRQKYKVILPSTTLNDNECYCPELDNGTKVALVRFPHAGPFELPILTVNNKNQECKEKFGRNPIDAIAINSHNADILSGADFDGDTVLIIPDADKQHIRSEKPLRWLEGFDPEESYGYGDIDISKKKIMKEQYKQQQMGVVSNLITDMTVAGAPYEEIAAATKHSMVVIDAIKHELDYSRSYKENNIDFLKKKYQGHYDLDGNWKQSGAATIISRAKNEWSVPQTTGEGHIDPETGKLVYKPRSKKVIDIDTGKKVEVPDPGWTDAKGVFHPYMKKTNQMSAVDDAFLLVSDTNNPIEVAYAEYANTLKAMANEARKESTKNLKLVRDPEVAKEYSETIDVLKKKILIAEANAPYERAALRYANQAKKDAEKDGNFTDEEISKITQRALTEGRIKYGAQRYPIDISDKEWEAIQAGAVSDNMLQQILKYADSDKLKQRAMPRPIDVLPDAKIARIQAMDSMGYTIAEIADRIDISTSTVKKYL